MKSGQLKLCKLACSDTDDLDVVKALAKFSETRADSVPLFSRVTFSHHVFHCLGAPFCGFFNVTYTILKTSTALSNSLVQLDLGQLLDLETLPRDCRDGVRH